MKAKILLVALILATATSLPGASNGDGWTNLNRVTKRRDYDFASRDGSCVAGRIVSVTDDSVTVRTARSNVKLNRADLVRVTIDSGCIVYSGRSSWADFSGYCLGPCQSAVITTRDGRVLNSKHCKASEAAIEIQDAGNDVTIAKPEVSRIDLISGKPLSDGDEYWLQECAVTAVCVLDFHLWPRYLGIGRTMRVRLYDSSMTEDDSPITCKKKP